MDTLRQVELVAIRQLVWIAHMSWLPVAAAVVVQHGETLVMENPDIRVKMRIM